MQTTLLLAALAASAAQASNLLPRQTGLDLPIPTDLSLGCATGALPLLGSMPTPPAELVSDASANPQSDPCSFETPSSLSSQYGSYSSEFYSWLSANEDDIQSVYADCPELTSYAALAPICSTELDRLLSGVTQTGTPTESAGEAAETEEGGSGAARNGGAAAAALAVAGLVVAVL
ncbi:hypothetical protein S40288_03126 [Stachybotrys chartarum IBT 40288]|nr:hypothetical protein S40288_03126 [Stachybotrys chartarum IBT 40288]